MKLNLGCGNKFKSGFLNIDIQDFSLLSTKEAPFRCVDIFHLHKFFQSESIEIIYSEFLFEHLSTIEISELLWRCHSLLIPGGTLSLIVPDFQELVVEWMGKINEGRFDLLDIFHLKLFSSPNDSLHKSVWSKDIGTNYLTREGLYEVKTIQSLDWGEPVLLFTVVKRG